mmetsp:Transcript_56079/g.47257  ORF Transcript_56079/g.47257 Transcript_56079/m.47257 type:complete len:154 (+) Transcript_56079:1045-1506(+)
MATIKGVRFFYETLRRIGLGMKIFELTSKKSHSTRQAITLSFKNASTESALLITTDVGSRGIDFSKVDWVIHYDMAESIETYVHRVGRTARFCAEGNSLILASPRELKYVNWLYNNNIPIDELKVSKKKLVSVKHKMQAVVFHNRDVKLSLEK